MAAAKKMRADSTLAQEKTMALIKKPETIVGVVVLGALSVLAFNVFNTDRGEQVSGTATESAEVASETSIGAEDIVQLSQDSKVSESTTEAIEEIAVLANTSSSRIVTARVGDSFWKLAEDYCKDGSAAESMAAANGYSYKKLQAGDQIEVICR